MNSLEISEILRKKCKDFGGVFPADSLSKLKSNYFYILNTEKFGETGEHWIAMYINNQCCEFFDSFGNKPDFYHKFWEKLLFSFSSNYVFNDKTIQNPNKPDCGKFCIFYVIMRSQGIRFRAIVQLLENVDLDNFLNHLVFNVDKH